ncbi:hypothetical protein [Paenibacillus sp. 2KB_22]|uniref:hypothetical protein n=1 Tax=Paenibacillus sp. 2KB_22 TaxID=3232978 RepID=UPI003F9A2E2E
MHCARWMQKQVAAKGTESILKKRSGRLCLWISPFTKGNQGNLETTAIIRTIRTRSGHPSAKATTPHTA